MYIESNAVGGQTNQPYGYPGSHTAAICYNTFAELLAERWINMLVLLNVSPSVL